jgi:hypothetical protein
MAFPTNPVNGQVYKTFTYVTSKVAWVPTVNTIEVAEEMKTECKTVTITNSSWTSEFVLPSAIFSSPVKGIHSITGIPLDGSNGMLLTPTDLDRGYLYLYKCVVSGNSVVITIGRHSTNDYTYSGNITFSFTITAYI